MSSLSEQPSAVTGGQLEARTSRFGGLDPAAPLPRISISLYPGALKGSFLTAHPVPAWAPRNGERNRMGNKSPTRVGEQEGGEEGSVWEGPGRRRKPARRWARVAESPGSRLSCCSQLSSPRASWMRAGGHGAGLPARHTQSAL